MSQMQREWFEALPWETVLSVNQAHCQTQETVHQTRPEAYEAARKLWEEAARRRLSLREALEVCRRCCELRPFVFNNANTFATLGKNLIEDLLQTIPPVDAQVARTTVAHFAAGRIGKAELNVVLRHFEALWQRAPNLAPAPAKESLGSKSFQAEPEPRPL